MMASRVRSILSITKKEECRSFSRLASMALVASSSLAASARDSASPRWRSALRRIRGQDQTGGDEDQCDQL